MATKRTTGKAAKQKRKVSGKRGTPARNRQNTRPQVDPRGIIGLAVLCIGVLALAIQFVPSSGGFLNQCMLFVRGMGGTLCLLLPVMVCWLGLMLIFFRDNYVSRRTLICGALLFLFVETMFQLFEVNLIGSSLIADGKTPGYFGFLLRSYQYGAMNWTGGGLIGALLAWPMVKALDVWGSMVVLVCGCAMVLMVLTGASFGELGMNLSEWLDDLRVQYKEYREEKMAQQQAREEEALEEARVIAQERQQKRAAKAQKEAEEAEAARAMKAAQAAGEAKAAKDETLAENAAADDADKPMDKPGKKGRGRAKLTVIEGNEQGETISPEPLFEQPTVAARANAPKRKARKTEATLFIERSDAFEREELDERGDDRARSRTYHFVTAQDLYAQEEEKQDASVYVPYGEKTVDYSSYQPVIKRDDMQRGMYEAQANGESAEAENAEIETAETQTAPWDDAPAYGAAYEAPYEVHDGNNYEAGFEAEEGTSYNEPIYAQYEDDVEPADAVQAYEEAADDEQVFTLNEPPMRRARASATYTDMHVELREDTGCVPSSIPARPNWSRGQRAMDAEQQGPTEMPSPDWAPMRSARPEELRPAGTPMKDRQQDTIVQLRGNRLDGTPLVMPKKDTHEGVQAMKKEYLFPPIDLLDEAKNVLDPQLNAKIEEGAKRLLATLESFGVKAKLTHVTHGPAITRYELQPAPGVKVSRIVNLVDDIALNMAADGVRIEAPIPGKPAVGIEIPNEKIEMVTLREVLESAEMRKQKSPSVVALGKGISGAAVVADLAKMPHVLIAGATGSGKSVCINTIINSIIFRASPDEVRLILIDPKVVELSVYNGVPHLLIPVVTDPKKASAALSWAVVEMEHRYKRFETMGVRNIEGYNNAIGPDEEKMSKIVIIVDELADLMMVAPGEVEESICRLAQLARAAGIHLVIATQRPSVNVITGVIKANIPSRIAFAVSSQIDSRTILDAGGAEKLLGKGDMLYAPQGAGKPTRVQGCFVSDSEVERIVSYVRGQHETEYDKEIIEQIDSAVQEQAASASAAADEDSPAGGDGVDELMVKAIELAIEAGQVSISMLQRRLRVGYARAGRLVDEMTLRGICGEAEGSKPRPVLISREEWNLMKEKF